MHAKELREEAELLRAQGLLIREIAEQIGVPKPTVTRWLNVEFEQVERRKAQQRKFSKQRLCPQCGAPMSNTSSLCVTCAKASQRRWTRERIIGAVQEWALEKGRPPAVSDWEKSGGERYPAVSSITDGPNPPFQRWSEVLLAAGFEPGRKGRRRRRLTEEEKRQRREMRKKLREARIIKAVLKGEQNGQDNREAS